MIMTVRHTLASVLGLGLLVHGNLPAQEADPNSLTPDEEEIGFGLLFNGREQLDRTPVTPVELTAEQRVAEQRTLKWYVQKRLEQAADTSP